MLTVSDEIATYTNTLFPDTSVDRSIIILIEKEFIRRKATYQHTIRSFEQKYQMDFNEFKKNDIIKKNNYSFEVENDYMDWEMAIDGLKTVNVKLKELQGNKSFSTRS